MKANELRIGNWIDHKSGRYQLTEDNFCSYVGLLKEGKIVTIELTAEILEKCGFVHDGNMKHFTHPNDNAGVFVRNGLRGERRDGLRIDKFTDGFFVETYYSGIEIKSLHQLQNLYYALTGEELEYTP